MTYGELLSEIAAQAGDTSSRFRTQARLWLNLSRAHIADEANWRTAFVADVPLTTVADTALYKLREYDSVLGTYTYFEAISGQYIYDETNTKPIEYQPFSELQAIDPNQEVTGQADYWGDAGVESIEGGIAPTYARQIYLWPIPDSAYTLRYPAYKRLDDVDSSMEGNSNDVYFGPVLPWSHTFMSGMRYFMDMDNNESAEQIALQRRAFTDAIRLRKKNNTLAPHAGGSLMVTRTTSITQTGRFDPSHYNNRQ